MMEATWVVVLLWTTTIAVRLLGASFLEKVPVWASWLTTMPGVRFRELSLDEFLGRPTRKLFPSSLVRHRPVGETLLHGVVLPRETICTVVSRFAISRVSHWPHGIHRPLLIVEIRVRRLVLTIFIRRKLIIHVVWLICTVLIGKV